jgi:hypothetical protein
MSRKLLGITIVMVLTFSMLSVAYLFLPTQAESLNMESRCKGAVKKRAGESFSVRISFKNKNNANGTWKITVVFEGEKWNWKGEEKQLTLDPFEKKTLTWEGTVPEDAETDSIARLVVYYNNDYTPLDWWIHVIPNPELSITYSQVW